MEFKNTIPEWENEGTPPPEDLRTNGFDGGDKPPAAWLNWLTSLVAKCVNEIQSNLSKVDNTSDSEKKVSFASEAKQARELQHSIEIHLDGGRTEGTDLFTFDGSTSRSVNITPEKINARPTEKPNIVVNAVREETDDGKEIYTATDSNIKELYNGLEVTIIPNENNANLSPRLNINNLGDKAIRLPLSFNCAATNALTTNFIQANRPITLKYHSTLNLGTQGQGAWIFADRQKTSAQDLYGDVPIEGGGTGASTAEDARENLDVYSKTEVDTLVPVCVIGNVVENTGANNYNYCIKVPSLHDIRMTDKEHIVYVVLDKDIGNVVNYYINLDDASFNVNGNTLKKYNGSEWANTLSSPSQVVKTGQCLILAVKGDGVTGTNWSYVHWLNPPQ